MEQVFNKLVRDNVPSIIEAKGEVAVTRILGDDEFKQELYKKLLEESNEVVKSVSKDELLLELADVLEVLKAIARLENKSLDDIIEVAEEKKKKRGAFEKRVFLEKTY